MLHAKGRPPLSTDDLRDQRDQLKALVDLCHIYGLAVIGDVVYNHAGGPFDPQSMRFFDRPWNREWWDRDNYFVAGGGWAGGRIFDCAVDEVRAFLIDNATMYLDDFHLDGLRYDEVTVTAQNGGQQFCRDITSTLRYRRPDAVQIAEYWNWDRALPVQANGLGFDAAWGDGLRRAIRSVLASAAQGASASLNLDPVRDAVRLQPNFPARWKTVVHLENHDIVDADRENPGQTEARNVALACEPDRRCWYARSRSRAASTLLLTAPGIPMLFMGQEFLEDKPWHNNPARSDLFIYWDGVKTDANMRDFLRFMQELCWLRRSHPALRAEGCNPFYVHNLNRVIAIQRWVKTLGAMWSWSHRSTKGRNTATSCRFPWVGTGLKYLTPRLMTACRQEVASTRMSPAIPRASFLTGPRSEISRIPRRWIFLRTECSSSRATGVTPSSSRYEYCHRRAPSGPKTKRRTSRIHRYCQRYFSCFRPEAGD